MLESNTSLLHATPSGVGDKAHSAILADIQVRLALSVLFQRFSTSFWTDFVPRLRRLRGLPFLQAAKMGTTDGGAIVRRGLYAHDVRRGFEGLGASTCEEIVYASAQ